jgi:serine-threonine kinase receptor-associated protein
LTYICTSNSKVWDTYTGDILASFPHQHIVRGCDFSGDGSRIVTGGMEKKLRIFDLNRDDLAGQPILSADGHTSVIRNVVWDGARNMILSSGDDMEIR